MSEVSFPCSSRRASRTTRSSTSPSSSVEVRSRPISTSAASCSLRWCTSATACTSSIAPVYSALLDPHADQSLVSKRRTKPKTLISWDLASRHCSILRQLLLAQQHGSTELKWTRGAGPGPPPSPAEEKAPRLWRDRHLDAHERSVQQ